jgi:imidazole glycerol phosphate synthase glutamine amidotransferase subunit
MIQIINTGVANIRSLQAAFDRIGAAWSLTEEAEQIESATHVVLPGVGAFAAAVESIDRLGIRSALVDRLNSDRATLCICLGLQLLCKSSDESPGVDGLGIIDQRITRFSTEVQSPQLGWNGVTPAADCREKPFELGDAYFANSFRLGSPPATGDWNFATTDYDGTFISSLWRSRTLACQFHPELSGSWGQSLLEGWWKNA